MPLRGTPLPPSTCKSWSTARPTCPASSPASALTARAADRARLAGTRAGSRCFRPASSDDLWRRLDSSVRNQVRKGRKHDLTVHWGGQDLLGEFYDVFSRNMRDLGTPVYSRKLFRLTLEQFGDRAELCVVRMAGKC